MVGSVRGGGPREKGARLSWEGGEEGTDDAVRGFRLKDLSVTLFSHALRGTSHSSALINKQPRPFVSYVWTVIDIGTL